MSMKIAGGAMGGVALPIVIEFAAKGARIHEKFPYKWSGVVGTGLGFVTGVLPAVWEKYPLTKDMTPENKNMLIAFGASDFATGVSILILDELKKRGSYEFQTDVPINMRGQPEGLQVPPEELIKEI